MVCSMKKSQIRFISAAERFAPAHCCLCGAVWGMEQLCAAHASWCAGYLIGGDMLVACRACIDKRLSEQSISETVANDDADASIFDAIDELIDLEDRLGRNVDGWISLSLGDGRQMHLESGDVADE